ncbi:sulfurtransferase [bacterium]|nr:sulfurtransferase [bacterium]
MKWGNIFTPAKVVTEKEAKDYMDKHETGSYQLVDVRTPEEYEEHHLPGAKLVPLNSLMEGGGNLDPEKPAIVYCRSGGRSKAATQWMSNQGFKEVYDISSNITTWLGLQLEGGYEYDLNLIRSDVEFSDAFGLAYAMEEGLQQFYLELEKGEERQELKAVYKKLAGFEDLHKEQLLKQNKDADCLDISEILAKQGDVVEGGEANRFSPFQIIKIMKEIQDIYALALAIEAQSFDLYVRLADKAENEETRKLFLHMADEEKTHMNYITNELSNYIKQVA